MSISKDDIYKVLITSLLSLIVYIGVGVLNNQEDISCRLRIVELNQARLMERIGVKPVSFLAEPLRETASEVPP